MKNVFTKCYCLYETATVLSLDDHVGKFIWEELGTFEVTNRKVGFIIKVLPIEYLKSVLVNECSLSLYSIHKDKNQSSSYFSIGGKYKVYWDFNTDHYKNNQITIYYDLPADSKMVWTVVEQWIKYAFLLKKKVFIHSSATTLLGAPIMFIGLRVSGKSRILHPILSKGGKYISDEFTILDESGKIYGYPPLFVDIDNRLKISLLKNTRFFNKLKVRCINFTHTAMSKKKMITQLFLSVLRKIGFKNFLESRVAINVLHADSDYVHEIDAIPVWVLLKPACKNKKKYIRQIGIEEAAEKATIATLGEFYLTQRYYDQYLYLNDESQFNADEFLLKTREIHRKIIKSALGNTKYIFEADANFIISDPEEFTNLLSNRIKKGN